jgi:hypothetical protein
MRFPTSENDVDITVTRGTMLFGGVVVVLTLALYAIFW